MFLEEAAGCRKYKERRKGRSHPRYPRQPAGVDDIRRELEGQLEKTCGAGRSGQPLSAAAGAAGAHTNLLALLRQRDANASSKAGARYRRQRQSAGQRTRQSARAGKRRSKRSASNMPLPPTSCSGSRADCMKPMPRWRGWSNSCCICRTAATASTMPDAKPPAIAAIATAAGSQRFAATTLADAATTGQQAQPAGCRSWNRRRKAFAATGTGPARAAAGKPRSAAATGRCPAGA